MMKKYTLSLLAIVLVVVALIAVLTIQNNSNPNDGTTVPGGSTSELVQYKSYEWAYFDTVTTIMGWAESSEEFNAVTADIYAALSEYHKLFDIYNSYEGIKNLRSINKLYNGEHKVVEVDRKIIDMLLYAKEVYVKTNGKTNIAMGSVLSIWHDYRTDAIDNNFGVGEL